MPTFRTIGGAEPSTITFSLDVVQLARNGSNVVREIQVIGDPDTSNGNAAVLAATPASTSWGLVVRPLFSSTGADNPVSVSNWSSIVSVANTVAIQGNSTVVVASGNSSVTITAGNSSVTITAGNSSVTISAGNSSVAINALASTGLTTLAAHAGLVKAVADVTGRPFIRTGAEGPAPQTWTANASPGGSTFATVTKSSAAGLRQVVTGFTATVMATSTAVRAFNSTIVLVDGAAGGSTFLWRSVVSLSSVANGIVSFNFDHLWLPAALAGPVTLEFQSSGDANTLQSVCMWGVSVSGE